MGTLTLYPDGNQAVAMCNDALNDVTEWLGFSNNGDYMHALDEEQEAIFQRATY